jgi:hypothetical protein
MTRQERITRGYAYPFADEVAPESLVAIVRDVRAAERAASAHQGEEKP